MTPSPLDRGTKLCVTVCRGCNLKEIVDFKGGEIVSQQYQDGFGKKDVEESEGKSRVEKDGS